MALHHLLLQQERATRYLQRYLFPSNSGNISGDSWWLKCVSGVILHYYTFFTKF